MFSRDHILHDNQASVNIFSNAYLLTGIRNAANGIVLNGVQADARGVRVDMEGDRDFCDVGVVYYSDEASANILSMAAMVDVGAAITYDQSENRFTLRPRGSESIYTFCRRNVPGSEGRFYVCDVKTMVSSRATAHPAEKDRVNVVTVSDNLKRYSKREVESAGKARQLLAKMRYPTVDMAIAMLRDGNNFDVAAYDFKVADAIWYGVRISPR